MSAPVVTTGFSTATPVAKTTVDSAGRPVGASGTDENIRSQPLVLAGGARSAAGLSFDGSGASVLSGAATVQAALDAIDDSLVEGAGVVSVKSFGAVGDGVSDDLAAFEAARDYCHALGGGVVWMPPGTYLISDELVFSTANALHTQLRGVGKYAATIKAGSADARVTFGIFSGVSAPYVGGHESGWHGDFTFDGDYVANRGVTCFGGAEQGVRGIEVLKVGPDVYDGAYSFSAPAAWAPSTGYVVGDVVQFGEIYYRCVEAHTSAASAFTAWATSTSYAETDQVVLDGRVWQAGEAHTSDASDFANDAGKWWDLGMDEAFTDDWDKWEVHHAGFYVAERQNTIFEDIYVRACGVSLVLDFGAGGNVFHRCEFTTGRINIAQIQSAIQTGFGYGTGPTDNTFIGCIAERQSYGQGFGRAQIHLGNGDHFVWYAGRVVHTEPWGRAQSTVEDHPVVLVRKHLRTGNGPTNISFSNVVMSGRYDGSSTYFGRLIEVHVEGAKISLHGGAFANAPNLFVLANRVAATRINVSGSFTEVQIGDRLSDLDGGSASLERVVRDRRYFPFEVSRPYVSGPDLDADAVLIAYRDGDSAARLRVRTAGIDMGSGSGNYDTNLYRVRANTLGTDDDFEFTDATKGPVFKAPGGARWRVTVGDDGALTTTVVT